MHKLAPLFALCLCPLVIGCGSSPRQRARSLEPLRSIELSKELTIHEIAPEVFQVEHRFPWAANSLLVKVSEGQFVFVDTPYTRLATQEVVEWLQRTFGEEVGIIEINTGYHVDNLGGNEYLQRAGIPIYGSFLTDRLLRDRGDKTRKQLVPWLLAPEHRSYRLAYESMSFYPPNELFNITDGLTFEFPGGTVEAYYPGPSHTEDNLVVYFSRQRLLFGGCMVKEAKATDLGFTADASLDKWPAAIEKVMDKFKDVEIVVPGHGAVGGEGLLDHTLALLEQKTP